MKKPGRPQTDSEAVNIRLPREMIDQLDDARRMVKDIPNRQEMVRRILAAWAEGKVYKGE